MTEGLPAKMKRRRARHGISSASTGARLALLALLAGLAGCGDPESGPPPPVDMQPADVGTDMGPDLGVGCEDGFLTVGDDCVDIDECAQDPPPCDPRVTCINLSGSFTCGACPAGFVGNGREGCARDCPAGEHDGGDAACVPRGTCSAGFALDEDGDCAPLECPDGEHFDGLDGCAPEGACAAGFALDDAGDCVAAACPQGQHDDGTGACGPLDGCADGFDLDPEGDCQRLTCPADDGHEPDDTPDDAGVLPADGAQAITCADDPDVFALDLGASCAVVVRLSVIDGAPTLALIDAAGDVLAEGEGAQTIEARAEPAGAVFARVGGAGIYRISASFEGHDGGDGACVALDACSPGWAADGAGDCVLCAAGFHDGGDGGCRPEGQCADGYALGGADVCVPVGQCAEGFRDDGTGNCAPADDACAEGFAEDGAGGCALPGVCAEGYAIDRRDDCRLLRECDPGLRDNGRGGCQGSCAGGFHAGGPEPAICLPEGDCQPGFVDRGDGRCGADCLAAYARAGLVCVGDYSCDGPDPDDPIEAEELAGPAPIEDGAPRFGVLCPGDTDHFVLEPPVGCHARVLLRFDPAEGALTVEAGPEGQAVTGFDAPGGQRMVLEALAGPVVLRVRGAEAVRYALRVDIDGHDGGDGRCQPLGECSPGYTFDGEGECGPCAEGYADDGEGRCVIEGRCADGFHDGGDGVCVPEDRCSAGHVDGNGDVPGLVCVPEGSCAAGFHDGNGEAEGTPCVPELLCSPGYHDGNGPAPGVPCLPADLCSDGFHDGGDGDCAAPDACSDGFHDGNGGEEGNPCLPEGTCARGLHDGGDGVCVLRGTCRPAYVDRGDGDCTADAALQTDCAAGYEYVFGDGGCACIIGTRDGGDGVCVPLDVCSPGFRPAAPGGPCVPVADCAAGHHATPWGECRRTADCGADRRDDGIGRCVGLGAGCAAGFGDRGGVCAAAPHCPAGQHDGGGGVCVADDRCALGFRRAAAGCVPDVDDVEGCVAADFDTARPLEDGPPTSGAVCGFARDTVAFTMDHRCAVDLRLVADDPQRVIDLVLFDAEQQVLDRVEVIDGQARIVIGEDGPREGFVQVVPVEPGAGTPVPYRLDLVRDPLRCAPCPVGSTADGAGGCIPPEVGCAPGFQDGGAGACVPLDRCSPGFRDGGDGRCAPFDECGAEHYLDQRLDCVPVAGCPGGQRDDGTGMCRVGCAEAFGYHDGGDGVCVAAPYCSAGYDDDGLGGCILRAPPAPCAVGTSDPSGLCLQAGCPDPGDRSSGVADTQPLDVELDGVTRLHGSLCPGDPGDWYAVVLDGSPLRVRLRFDHGSNDMGLRILTAQGAPLAAADSGDDDEITEVPPTAGVVLVEVTGDGRNAGYRLDLVRQ